MGLSPGLYRHVQRAGRGRRGLAATAALVLVPLVVTGCTDSGSSPPAGSSGSPARAADSSGATATSAATPTVAGAAGSTIPARTTAPVPPTSAAPTVPPTVLAFDGPTSFTCLVGRTQGQVTLGWNVTGASAVSVQLDGSSPPVGIQDALPFQVPAGKPVGVGSTVVFDCRAASRHTITVRWSAGSDAHVTERSVTVVKEGS